MLEDYSESHGLEHTVLSQLCIPNFGQEPSKYKFQEILQLLTYQRAVGRSFYQRRPRNSNFKASGTVFKISRVFHCPFSTTVLIQALSVEVVSAWLLQQLLLWPDELLIHAWDLPELLKYSKCFVIFMYTKIDCNLKSVSCLGTYLSGVRGKYPEIPSNSIVFKKRCKEYGNANKSPPVTEFNLHIAGYE